jgi:transcriptional regulator with XRE-family HTH domain
MQTIEQHPLTALLAERGLTYEAVAQRAGVSRATVTRIAQGTHITHTESLRAIARALNVSWQELCGPGQAAVARSRAEVDEITARDAEEVLAALAKVYRRDSSDPEDRAWLVGLVQSWVDAAPEEQSA